MDRWMFAGGVATILLAVALSTGCAPSQCSECIAQLRDLADEIEELPGVESASATQAWGGLLNDGSFNGTLTIRPGPSATAEQISDMLDTFHAAPLPTFTAGDSFAHYDFLVQTQEGSSLAESPDPLSDAQAWLDLDARYGIVSLSQDHRAKEDGSDLTSLTARIDDSGPTPLGDLVADTLETVATAENSGELRPLLLIIDRDEHYVRIDATGAEAIALAAEGFAPLTTLEQAMTPSISVDTSVASTQFDVAFTAIIEDDAYDRLSGAAGAEAARLIAESPHWDDLRSVTRAAFTAGASEVTIRRTQHSFSDNFSYQPAQCGQQGSTVVDTMLHDEAAAAGICD